MTMNTMLTQLTCLNCATANQPAARTCGQCGAPLTVARADMYLDQAQAAIRVGKYDRAYHLMSQADTEMFRLSEAERKAHQLTARAFLLQGQVYYNKGQIDDARAESLLALQNLADTSSELRARVLNLLGNTALYHEDNDTAASYYQQAADAARQVDAHNAAAVALSNLALIYTTKGLMSEAATIYEEAITLAERTGNALRIADTYRSAAHLYLQCGPASRAIEYISKALDQRAQISDAGGLCRILQSAGEIALACGDLAQAERWMHEVDELAHRSEYKLLFVPIAANLAHIMMQHGNYEQALNYVSAAANQIVIVPSQRATTALIPALYYAKTGDVRTSQKYLQRLEQISANHASYHDHFALQRAQTIIEAIQGNWPLAAQHYQAALVLAEAQHTKYDAVNLSVEYATALLDHPLVTQYPAVQQHARALLAQAATTFDEMQMPLRVARIEQLLQPGGPPPVPIRLTTSLSKYGLQ